jgi:hypothetical protein
MTDFLPSIDQVTLAISNLSDDARKSLHDDICGLDVSDTDAVRAVTRRLAAETRLSQDVLASAVGYSQSMLARYLGGTNSNIGIALVKVLRSCVEGNTLRPASVWVSDWDAFAINFAESEGARDRARADSGASGFLHTTLSGWPRSGRLFATLGARAHRTQFR